MTTPTAASVKSAYESGMSIRGIAEDTGMSIRRTRATKAGNVAAFLSKGTLDDLRAEIAKCEVVCANCHRIRTKGRVPVTRGRSRR